MLKTLVLCLMLCTAHVVTAQKFFTVEHIKGIKAIENNHVTVTSLNNASENEFCSISPYWIGNEGMENGYSFSFTKPVGIVKMYLTALNKSEEISFSINGIKYNLSESDVLPYKNKCTGRENLFSISSGNLSFKDESFGYTSAIVEINSIVPIYTFSVNHMNGKQNGVVFNLAYSYGGSSDNNSENNNGKTIGGVLLNSTSINVIPNPSSGKFTINGVVATDNPLSLTVCNAVGQVVYSSTIVSDDQTINKVIDLEKGIATGVYLIRLSNDDVSYTKRLLIDKK